MTYEIFPRTTAMGLWTDASEMVDAADILIKTNRNLIQPIYFLLGHSLELAMKVMLISAGTSLSEVKAIGHNLSKALDALKPLEIAEMSPILDERKEHIDLLNQSYVSKTFEYRVTGSFKYPQPELLSNVARKLIQIGRSRALAAYPNR